MHYNKQADQKRKFKVRKMEQQAEQLLNVNRLVFVVLFWLLELLESPLHAPGFVPQSRDELLLLLYLLLQELHLALRQRVRVRTRPRRAVKRTELSWFTWGLTLNGQPPTCLSFQTRQLWLFTVSEIQKQLFGI